MPSGMRPPRGVKRDIRNVMDVLLYFLGESAFDGSILLSCATGSASACKNEGRMFHLISSNVIEIFVNQWHTHNLLNASRLLCYSP